MRGNSFHKRFMCNGDKLSGLTMSKGFVPYRQLDFCIAEVPRFYFELTHCAALETKMKHSANIQRILLQ